MENISLKKEKTKLSPEQLFNIYLECNNPQAPLKTILERQGLKPWDLVAIRKRIRDAAIEALENPLRKGRKLQTVSLEQFQKNVKELQETKDALAAVGYELALLKKKVS